MELPFCQMTPKMLSEPPWMKSFLSIFSCLVSLLTATIKWLSSAFNKPWSHTSLLVDVCECVCVSVVNDLVVYLETSLHPQLGKLTLLLTLGDTLRGPLISPHPYLFSVQLWTSHCQDMYFFAWGLSLNTWLNTWELTALIHPHTHLKSSTRDWCIHLIYKYPSSFIFYMRSFWLIASHLQWQLAW